jgi:hypothetical protein
MHDAILESLPQEVRDEIARPEQERAGDLAGLGEVIGKMRDEAVTARASSGIEKQWLECEEAYIGIDDENRAEFAECKWAKPMTMEGGLVDRSNSSDGIRATAYIKLTTRYVDIAAAKVCEIAIPVDGRPFTLDATPVPTLASAMDDNRLAQDVAGEPMPGHDGQPVKVSDLAKHQQSKASAKAEKAADRINDWLVECGYDGELRRVVFDGARIGTGIVKGPASTAKTHVSVSTKNGAIAVEMVTEIKPTAKRVDAWCFYPAPGVKEDIHAGGHCFESDTMLEDELLALCEQPNYIAEAIKKVVKEGPNKAWKDSGRPNDKKHDKQFTIWHFYGMVERAQFEAANEAQAKDLDDEIDKVPCIVTLVNDTVIRAVLTPMDSGRLPFHVFTWRRRAGCWAGVGVAEQIRTPQRIINATWRRLLTNAALSAGAHVVMRDGAVEPANKSLAMTPDKLWLFLEDSGIDDVRKVFATFQWPNATPQLLTIIEGAYRLAEEHTSIPLVTQGQSGKTTPDTFGGQQLQDNNANQLLRDVGFGLSDQITRPMIEQFYEWLLLDPDVPDDEKGDYSVDTSGAMALIEKALNDQAIVNMYPMLGDPDLGLSKRKWFEAYCRRHRMRADDFLLSEAEQKERANRPPPEAPQVQAAKIRAEVAVQTAQSRDALLAEKVRADTDRDTAYVQSMATREQAQSEYRLRELALRERLALLEYATQERISLDRAKVQLAQTTMELSMQRELAGADGTGPQVATPPIEPAGRAAPGRAFQD